jgi:hypothetical protein
VSFDRRQEGRSVRVRVARAALQAALDVPGVLGSDRGRGGVRVTADPASGPLIGVSATAQSDGRYAIDLSLVADMVPLPALAEEVRSGVRRRADGEQLGSVLGAVNVEFASVVTAEEFAAAAAVQQVEETILAEELAAGAAIAQEAAEATAPGPGSLSQEAPEPVAAPASAAVAAEGERLLEAPAAGPTPRRSDAAAVLAARQAALATDQAALAAQQAALAAEQAALAGERAALAAESVAPLGSLESEQLAGSAPKGDGEPKR